MKNLYCFYNQLTSLDVRKNVSLQKLNCYNNKLTSLDVSKNISLTNLEAGFNQIKTICVADVAKAMTNSTTKDSDGYYYWQKDITTIYTVCP